jgi:hypothetical protein
MNTISALEPLPLRFCHHAIQEMLFGAAARLRSIPHKLLRTAALVEPTEFSSGFLADFRPAVYRHSKFCGYLVLGVASFQG